MRGTKSSTLTDNQNNKGILVTLINRYLSQQLKSGLYESRRIANPRAVITLTSTSGDNLYSGVLLRVDHFASRTIKQLPRPGESSIKCPLPEEFPFLIFLPFLLRGSK